MPAPALAEAIETTPSIPEFMQQRIAVANGSATWDDFSFEERTCRGWLVPYLLEIDDMFSKRWSWWVMAMELGELPAGEIPQIEFLDSPNSSVLGNLQKCMEYGCSKGDYLSSFLEWLLWGLGGIEERSERPGVSEKTNEFWYKTFNLGPIIQYPHDYLGVLLSNNKSGYWNNPHNFYPTPHAVVKCMVQMNMADARRDEKDIRLASVCDPCLGTGRMLLEASNYSVNLWGNDIDLSCVMASKINGFWYAPWMVRSAPWVQRGIMMGEEIAENVENSEPLVQQVVQANSLIPTKVIQLPQEPVRLVIEQQSKPKPTKGKKKQEKQKQLSLF